MGTEIDLTYGRPIRVRVRRRDSMSSSYVHVETIAAALEKPVDILQGQAVPHCNGIMNRCVSSTTITAVSERAED